MAESEERVDSRSWFWTIDALHRSRPGVPGSVGRLHLSIAETVLFNEGEAVAWVFTSKEGEVKRKHTKRLKLETIVESLCIKARHDAELANARPAQRHAVAVRRGNDSATDVKCELMPEEDVRAKSGEGGGLTGGLLALQCAVHPRGGGGTRYRCEAASSGKGGSLRYTMHKLCYLGAPAEADAPHPRSSAGSSLGVGPAFSLKCAMNSLNEELQQRTSALISHLNDVGRTRIVRLQADFILSATTGMAVLVSVPLCHTIALPAPPRHSTSSALTPAASGSAMPKAPTDPQVISTLMRAASLPQLPPADQAFRMPADAYSSASLAGPAKDTPAGAKGRRKSHESSAKEASAAGLVTPASRAAAATTTPMSGVRSGSVSSLNDDLLGFRPQSATALLSSPLHRPQSQGSCYRPGPWMRLHPPIPKSFGEQKAKGAKHLVCTGDFCHVNPAGEPEEEDTGHVKFRQRGESPTGLDDGARGASGRASPKKMQPAFDAAAKDVKGAPLYAPCPLSVESYLVCWPV